MGLMTRRKLELDQKLASLSREMAEWSDRTTREPMRRHYSQVVRLNRVITALLASMTTSTDWKAPTEDIALANAVAWEKRILTAYAIWELFRSKLAQRDESFFQQRLLAYDDLAWACYEPAMKRYSATPKEPPLLFLNSTWSAYLQRRDSAFDTDVEKGKDAGAAVEAADYRAAMKKLPFPLLALPWFQVSHVPSALLIAHEVGHAVEFDFDLTATIDKTLAAAALQRSADWRACASEVFADLYGILCLGGYLAGALLDLIAASREAVAMDLMFGRYPTRSYRMELAATALDYLGLPDDALRTRQTWQAVYGPLPEPATHRADLLLVVNALYSDQGMNLAALIKPPTGNIKAIAQYAREGNRKSLDDLNVTDARTLFCALRYIYENNTEAQLAKATPLLLERIVKANAAVFRYRGEAVPTQKDTQDRLDALEDVDRAAGKELEELLGL
jgi:hypothetical protein